MDEKQAQQSEIDLYGLNLQYREIERPIQSAEFYSTGGRMIRVDTNITDIRVTITHKTMPNEENRIDTCVSFDKRHLGGYIKLLQRIHDQMK